MTDPAKSPHDEYFQEILRDIVAAGARLVHNLEVRATAEPESNPVAEVATAFDRLTRAVRRSIVLHRHLDLPAPAALAERKRTTARRQIIRAVEDAIADDARAKPETDRLRAELHERLDSPDLDDEIDDRPIPEIIADICRDLGIGLRGGQQSKRRTPADIADLCARAANRPRPDPFRPDPARPTATSPPKPAAARGRA